MPAPRWLARFNRRVTNRVLGPLATHLPGFGVVVHTGRKTGRRYRTPVNVFRRADCYIIALTYGRDAQWVRNVLASGGCTLETRGRVLRLMRPRLFHDARRRAVPALAAWYAVEQTLRQALKQHPENEGVRRRLVRLLLEYGQEVLSWGQHARATKLFEEGQRLAPDEYQFPLNLARIAVEQSQSPR